MTWEIIVGLIALVGFISTIGGMVWKLSSVISRLDMSVSELTRALDKMQDENESEHKEFRSAIGDHEKRITKLEAR